MFIKRFKELEEEQIDMLIDVHFNHWSKVSSRMKKVEKNDAGYGELFYID